MSNIEWMYLLFALCCFLSEIVVRQDWERKRDAVDYWSYFIQSLFWPIKVFMFLFHATRYFKHEFREWKVGGGE